MQHDPPIFADLFVDAVRRFSTYLLTKDKLMGHDVFEFAKGVYSGTHWAEDSIYLSEDLFQQKNLEPLFRSALSSFSYFGITTVHKNDWEEVKEKTKNNFPQVLDIINEIDEWVKGCFATEECFTICGI